MSALQWCFVGWLLLNAAIALAAFVVGFIGIRDERRAAHYRGYPRLTIHATVGR